LQRRDEEISSFQPRRIDMGDKGKKDKGQKEKKKEPQMTLKEKRAAKKDKIKKRDSI
jgi:hypothetical protein